MKRVAVLKSKVQSTELVSLLNMPSRHSCILQSSPEQLSARLSGMEAKLSQILDVLAGSALHLQVGWSPDGLVYHEAAQHARWNLEAPEFVPDANDDVNMEGKDETIEQCGKEPHDEEDEADKEQVCGVAADSFADDLSSLDAREKDDKDDNIMSESDRGADQGLEKRQKHIDASLLVACADTVAAMYASCKEDVSLGPYSKMTPACRDRSRTITGEFWDGFESLCKQGGVQTYPETLSSAAGCITTMFADVEPDEDQFGKMLLSEISMM